MKKKVIVLSLGGSLIIPNDINHKYLSEFKKIIKKNSKKYKFVVVCGGGNLARKYIGALKKSGLNLEYQNLAGISATRTNARFMNYFFKINPTKGIPRKTKQIKNHLKTYDIIFCGGLEYKPNQTSDSTAANLAKKLKCEFVNLTNVKGLYDKNPHKFKNAKLIKKTSWKKFDKVANKSKFTPGQHFILDQTASKIIKKYKIPTYIIGNDIKQFDNFLNKKKFVGTTISD